MNILNKISHFIYRGDSRSVLIKKNIISSFFIKGWSAVIQLLLVPLTLNCLNAYEYGIWLIINSILIGIDSFDIGLGNGMRNKLAESLALGDQKRAKGLVSTTFFMLLLIIIPLLLLLLIIINNIDCYSLLNVDPALITDLPGLLMITLAVVSNTFIFKIVGNFYLGLQLPAVNNLLVVCGQTLSLIAILLLSYFKVGTLLYVSVVYTVSPLIVYLISFLFTFYQKYSYYSPSFSFFNWKLVKELFGLGIGFFVLQMAGLILFASTNVLISKLFNPTEVVPYQISYRFFGLVTMLFGIIISPLWSATTDAYTRGEIDWIKKSMRKMQQVLFLFVLLLLLMLVISPFIYRLWIGNDIHISFTFSMLMAIYTFILIYSLCYSQFLFGIGCIRVAIIVTVVEAAIYIPLAILFSRIWGVYGIVIALLLVNLLCMITNQVQYNKIVGGTAKGIWLK